MKNDTTWERTDNSELDKQQAARSHGNLAGSRSKTPSPIPHSPSPLRSKTFPLSSLLITHLKSLLSAHLHDNLVSLRSKAPSSIIHNPSSNSQGKQIEKNLMKLPSKHTIKVLLARKAWITGQLEGGKRGKEIPVRLKHYLNAEYTALTRVIDFTSMMLEYIPDKQVLQEILCRYERDNEERGKRKEESDAARAAQIVNVKAINPARRDYKA